MSFRWVFHTTYREEKERRPSVVEAEAQQRSAIIGVLEQKRLQQEAARENQSLIRQNRKHGESP